MDNKEHTNELSKMAPRLQALREQIPPVQAPEGYYERMTEDVMQKVKTSHSAKRRSLPGRKWMGMAAALALSLLAVWWLFQKEQPNTSMAELNWDTIPTEEVQSYVLDNIDEFELDWIIQEQDIEVTPAYNIPEDEIRNYLEEEALDNLEELF